MFGLYRNETWIITPNSNQIPIFGWWVSSGRFWDTTIIHTDWTNILWLKFTFHQTPWEPKTPRSWHRPRRYWSAPLTGAFIKSVGRYSIQQKTPHSTFEAGIIWCAQSFSIQFERLKDECIIFIFRLNPILAKAPEKSMDTQRARVEKLKAEGWKLKSHRLNHKYEPWNLVWKNGCEPYIRPERKGIESKLE